MLRAYGISSKERRPLQLLCMPSRHECMRAAVLAAFTASASVSAAFNASTPASAKSACACSATCFLFFLCARDVSANQLSYLRECLGASILCLLGAVHLQDQ